MAIQLQRNKSVPAVLPICDIVKNKTAVLRNGPTTFWSIPAHSNWQGAYRLVAQLPLLRETLLIQSLIYDLSRLHAGYLDQTPAQGGRNGIAEAAKQAAQICTASFPCNFGSWMAVPLQVRQLRVCCPSQYASPNRMLLALIRAMIWSLGVGACHDPSVR